MMKSRNLVAASVVLFLVFLFTVTGFCAGDGKVTMDQWIKIIESKGVKSPPPAKTTETKNMGDIYRPDSSTSPDASGIAVTVYWHMADDADVYLNGKPLRSYEPSFKTRPDEAPRPAFAASAILRNGDVFTVGGRRGGSFGFMLIAVNAAGKVVFQSDQQSWNVYEPGERPDWFSPSVAIAAGIKPVTVQPDPWYPQKELNTKYGNKAVSIWSNPSNTFAYLYGIVGDSRAPEKSRMTDSDVPKIKADSGTQRFEGEKSPLSGKPGAATVTVIEPKTAGDGGGTTVPWTTGQSKTYTPISAPNATVKDDLTGNTFSFPDGGSGSLTITKILEGPNTTETDNVFSVSYSGTGKVKLVVPGKPNEVLCVGYTPLAGNGILLAGGGKNTTSVWMPIPERDNGNGTVSFELPLQKKKLAKSAWGGISEYKTLNVTKIKDDVERFEKMVREVANTLIGAIPNDKKQTVMDLINGDLLPQVYVNTDVEHACYRPFSVWDHLGYATRKLIMFNPRTHKKNNVAHEFGHYMHHYLTGDYYTNFSYHPRGPGHAVGETGARNNIIEEPAYLSEYYCLGKIANAWDPEQGDFCVEPRETGGKNYPSTDDFLDVEGFGVMLMASVVRTRTTITDYKGRAVEVPVMKPEQSDRTSFFQDMYDIIESGENSMDGIATSIVSLASTKYGGSNAVKKLSAMWQPLGYTYVAKCNFVDKDKNPIKGVTAQPFIKLADGKEYKLTANTIVSNMNGEYQIPENFPGTSSLRVSYATATGEKITVDLENKVKIDWTRATNNSVELGEFVIDAPPAITRNPKITTGTRFIDKGNGTIYDTVSKLTWLRNANCFGTQTWENAKATASTLASGKCGLSDGSKAGDWHLPTITELQILVDVDAGYGDKLILTAAGFIDVGGSYWSSSTYKEDAAYAAYEGYRAWFIAFGGSILDNGKEVSVMWKSYPVNMWPVRVGQ